MKRHCQNVAREARENGASNTSVPRSVPPHACSGTAPWAAYKPLTEVDKVHDSDQTAVLRAALALFENCNLPPGVLEDIRKIVPSATESTESISRANCFEFEKRGLKRRNKSFASATLRLNWLEKLPRTNSKKLWNRQLLSVS